MGLSARARAYKYIASLGLPVCVFVWEVFGLVACLVPLACVRTPADQSRSRPFHGNLALVGVLPTVVYLAQSAFARRS